MAAAASTEDQWRRRDDGDLDEDDEPIVGEEDGEIVVPGSHSDTTDTDEYYNRHSPSECDDEADSGRGATTSAVVVPANIGGNAGSSRSSVARVLGWGGTGRQGRTGLGAGGMSVSPSAETEHVHQSMAVVGAAAPKPVLQPVPLAFEPPSSLPPSSVPTVSGAGTNLFGQSSIAQSAHDDAVGSLTAAGAEAAVPPAEAAAVHHHLVAPPPRPAPAAGRQNPDGYRCGKCGMWFATHQALGGHSVGHKHREQRELLLAAPGGRRDDEADAKRRERVHVCGDCGAEFATGVQLGGHKRKHWAGAPIVPKKKPRAVVVQPPLPPPAADLALPLPIRTDQAAPPAVELAVEMTPQPATATRSPVAGRVRLFGVDIVPAVQTPQAQQG